jgi:hypothetical protein
MAVLIAAFCDISIKYKAAKNAIFSEIQKVYYQDMLNTRGHYFKCIILPTLAGVNADPLVSRFYKWRGLYGSE